MLRHKLRLFRHSRQSHSFCVAVFMGHAPNLARFLHAVFARHLLGDVSFLRQRVHDTRLGRTLGSCVS
jgi:hypothetical protein